MRYSNITLIPMACKRSELAKRLVIWFQENARDYPWRHTNDPYKILVAELMLQRTAARQVEPIYRRFIDKFPSPFVLASATLKELTDELKPLGLAYRASRFLNIGKMLTEKFNGAVPCEENQLLKLPGVGKYVARAILCFAFGQDVALVDSNIIRVIKRVFSLDLGKYEYKKRQFWKFMDEMVPKGEAKEFNFSLIDLGDLICTPRNPHHDICPLREICDLALEHSNRCN